MRGIILAGGSGTRLAPITTSVSKQLLPVYDKPMIYYPLSTLLLAKIRDILVISTPQDIPRFELLLKDGAQWGANISYAVQPSPDGLAHAFIVGSEFIGSHPSVLILGDNIFYGHQLGEKLRDAAKLTKGAKVFSYRVKDPERYGVVTYDTEGRVTTLEEKPSRPKSNDAVTGLYFYDSQVTDIARNLKPSARGELEITDINKHYHAHNQLSCEPLGRGMAWLDTGTHEALLEAATYIETIDKRTGLKISCPEEIAYRLGFIDRDQLAAQAHLLANSSYGQYLVRISEEGL